jgi:glycosyltransferase involved in cell wall biosynthesis
MISVIIPCYNCGKHIKRAIESVLAQTYTDYEILLVNNNSIDNSIDIMRYYWEKYPNVFKILHETKKGAPAARNKGLHEAKGRLIQYLDADDELMPDKLERQSRILIENDADVLAGCFWEVKGGKNTRRTLIIPSQKNIWLSLVSSNLGRTSANLWKTETLLAVNGWNETLSSSQEYDLLFRMLKTKSRICFDTIPSTFIYFTENSISKSVNNERNSQIFDNWLNLRLTIKEYLRERGLLNGEVNKKIDVIIFNYLRFKGRRLPAYAIKKLESLIFDLPLKLKLKKNLVLLKFKWISIMGSR